VARVTGEEPIGQSEPERLFYPVDEFRTAAARISPFRAAASNLSPSWKSIARLTFPARLELKRPPGSLREAPLAKVVFITCL